ncbi:unnamed protein product [Linum trigynum]|uniref:Uncharacterized protein n=1 Tax=Linum trigynum TaxID=586398 RepID=A0AAV2FTC6_9ROSI
MFDAGNNNKMKANYHPSGIDFHSGVEIGRYSNGRLTTDIIGELLGFKSSISPSASAPNDSEIMSTMKLIQEEKELTIGTEKESLDGQKNRERVSE